MNKLIIELATVTAIQGVGIGWLFSLGDDITLAFCLALLAVIVILPINGILLALCSVKPTQTQTITNPQQEEDLTIEDSQGDGLMSEGDIMFPEENEDED